MEFKTIQIHTSSFTTAIVSNLERSLLLLVLSVYFAGYGGGQWWQTGTRLLRNGSNFQCDLMQEKTEVFIAISFGSSQSENDDPYLHLHYFVFFSHPDLWLWNISMLICLLQKLSSTQDLYCSKMWIGITDQAHHKSSLAPGKLVCFRTAWLQSAEPAGFIAWAVCAMPNAPEPWLQCQWEGGLGRWWVLSEKVSGKAHSCILDSANPRRGRQKVGYPS